MSDYEIQVSKTITVEVEYETWNLDEDQALELYTLLGEALGKVSA